MTTIAPDPVALQHRRELAAALAGWRNPYNEMAVWQPTTAEQTAALVEDVDWLLSCGETPDRVAERVGRSVFAVQKALQRAERHDLAHHFDQAVNRARRIKQHAHQIGESDA